MVLRLSFRPRQMQLTTQLAALATDLRKEIHTVDNKIEKRFSDLLLATDTTATITNFCPWQLPSVFVCRCSRQFAVTAS